MPLPPFAYNVSTTSRGEPITGEDWNFAMGWIGGTTSTGAVDPDAHAHTGLASAGAKINFSNLLSGVNQETGTFSVAGIFSAARGFQTASISSLGTLLPVQDNLFDLGQFVPTQLRWRDGIFAGTLSAGNGFRTNSLSILGTTSFGGDIVLTSIGSTLRYSFSNPGDVRVARKSGTTLIFGDVGFVTEVEGTVEVKISPGVATTGITRFIGEPDYLAASSVLVTIGTDAPGPIRDLEITSRITVPAVDDTHVLGTSNYFGAPRRWKSGVFAGAVSTGGIFPVTDNSFDIGTPITKWRNAYFSGTLSVGTTLSKPAIVLIDANETEVTGTTTNLSAKTFSLPANGYQSVIVESEISLVGEANVEDEIGFDLRMSGGGTPQRTVSLKQDATGAGDTFNLAGAIKWSQVQKTATTISVGANVVTGAGTWRVMSLRVYGVS